MNKDKMKLAYVITKRNNRHYWNRVGVAFMNGDGSINVKLEAMPVSGELQIRDYEPRDRSQGGDSIGTDPSTHTDRSDQDTNDGSQQPFAALA